MKVVLKRKKRVKLNRSQTFPSENVRVLEDGTERLTESGDKRTLE